MTRQQKYRATEKGKATRRAWVARDRAKNKEKYLIRERETYYRLKDVRKDRQYKYGISVDEQNALLAKQAGCCAICKTAEPGQYNQWHLDHDHKTNKIRGFLCAACNSGLGYFKDTPALLTAAATYLQEPPYAAAEN